MKKHWLKIILIAIFLTSFLLMVFSARLDSSTTDESIHLFSGLTYLTQGDFRFDPEHPPLIKEIAALPLLIIKPHYQLDADWQAASPFYYDAWKETRNASENFLYAWGNNAGQLLFWGRLMMIFLTLALGLAVYLYAKKLYGEKAGVLAAFLTLFFPLCLSHGRLVNTDLGVTLFGFLTIYFWGQYLKSPSWFGIILAGIFSGLMLSTKYTAVIFLIVMVVLAIVRIWQDKKLWPSIIGGFLLTLVISFLVVWSTYGFKILVPPMPNESFTAEIAAWQHYNLPGFTNNIFNVIRPFLIPSYYYKGLIMVFSHATGGHGSFLLGMNSNKGWWYYFPVAIFFKTPIAFFIPFGLSLYYYRKTKAKNSFDELVLIVSPLIYLAVSMSSHADLGFRHILPIFPFLFVFTSKAINAIDFRKFSWSLVIFSGAVLWYLIVAFGSFPNYIAYFNEFAGGSKNGDKILTDSNLDWGQDILRIKQYIDDSKLTTVYLVYPWDGEQALKYYGINSILLLPENQNIHGTVIISATYYQTEAYVWLKKYPFTEITPGVFVVQIP